MRLLDACARKPVDATPVWLMRQAGRYLPEYRAIREKMSFVEMCRRPDIAAEVTLQPLRRFELDAAIVFADILLPLEPMGIGFHFSKDDGPVIERPIRSARDLEGVHSIDAASDLQYVMDTIKLVRHELDATIPLIGFSGRPVHPRELHRRGRPLAQLRARQEAHVRGPGDVRPPHEPHLRGRGRLPQGADRRRRPGRAALRLLGRLARPLRLRAPRAAARALRRSTRSRAWGRR